MKKYRSKESNREQIKKTRQAIMKKKNPNFKARTVKMPTDNNGLIIWCKL